MGGDLVFGTFSIQWRVARPSNRRSRNICGWPVLRVLCEGPALSEVEGAGTTTAYTTGGVERTRVAPAASPPTTPRKKRRDGAPSWEWCNAKIGHPPPFA